MSFAARALDALRREGPLCIGIDPRPEDIPPSLRPRPEDEPCEQDARLTAVARFMLGLVEIACSEGVAFVKPQSAFFEALGANGMWLLEEVLRAARGCGRLAIADAKRNDIGSTAEAYAHAFFGPEAPFRADALTVNPWTGPDGLEPFIDAAVADGGGLFVLVRTSNPGAALLQDAALAEGGTVSAKLADWLTARAAALAGGADGYGPLGAVIGATAPQAARALRERLPRSLLLAPGVGAQGARAEDLAPYFDRDGLGAIIPVSRGIAGAWRDHPEKAWEDAVAERTRALKRELREVAARARRGD